MGLNKVMLTGRALRAPTMRWISDTLPVAEFPIVVEKTFKTSTGKEKTNRLEILVQAYGPVADHCKGGAAGEVHVEGRLRIEDRKDGDAWKHTYSIVAESCEFEAATVEPASEAPRRPRAARSALAQSA
jgi:single-stranded DNA-binding protein